MTSPVSRDSRWSRPVSAAPTAVPAPGRHFLPRAKYREEAEQRILGGCGLMGVCDQSGARMSGELAVRSMASMHDRGNGLGGGFAGYGIYPELPHLFCFHLLYDEHAAKQDTEFYLRTHFRVIMDEPIPTKPVRVIENEPILWRYFLDIAEERLQETQLSAEDYVVHAVMDINTHVDGAFVASSGKNMGAFKGVGFPEEVGEFYRIDEYRGWTWTISPPFRPTACGQIRPPKNPRGSSWTSPVRVSKGAAHRAPKWQTVW